MNKKQIDDKIKIERQIINQTILSNLDPFPKKMIINGCSEEIGFLLIKRKNLKDE
ncbi:hypothetical protein Harreka1_64 [Olleya phage Harreka_1]|uniref:Uncharacterized protein n=1 Tax=Olleya phage Harreka_1 TaxID=2745673 RepID=A0A8E4ZCD2_9CAUD|nr:hypothetical protein M1M26_gp64 [Olleya phage Harreka_1]QQV90471.1 hypothetical protein Harreka1_64 [Olleya phage Harreka_1]